MDMRDHTIQGFVAGLIGSMVEMFFTLTMYYGFGLPKYRFMDFAGAINFNQIPDSLLVAVIAESIVYVFCGFLGVVFVMMLKVLSSQNIILKGASFGILYWFLINAFVTAFRIEGLYPTNFVTSTVHLIGGLIYGATTAYAYTYLAKEYKQTSVNFIPQPVLRPLDQENQNEK